MEALSLEELEMVSGGNNIDTGNMREAAKALSADPPVTQSFVWIKKTH